MHVHGEVLIRIGQLRPERERGSMGGAGSFPPGSSRSCAAPSRVVVLPFFPPAFLCPPRSTHGLSPDLLPGQGFPDGISGSCRAHSGRSSSGGDRSALSRQKPDEAAWPGRGQSGGPLFLLGPASISASAQSHQADSLRRERASSAGSKPSTPGGRRIHLCRSLTAAVGEKFPAAQRGLGVGTEVEAWSPIADGSSELSRGQFFSFLFRIADAPLRGPKYPLVRLQRQPSSCPLCRGGGGWGLVTGEAAFVLAIPVTLSRLGRGGYGALAAVAWGGVLGISNPDGGIQGPMCGLCTACSGARCGRGRSLCRRRMRARAASTPSGWSIWCSMRSAAGCRGGLRARGGWGSRRCWGRIQSMMILPAGLVGGILMAGRFCRAAGGGSVRSGRGGLVDEVAPWRGGRRGQVMHRIKTAELVKAALTRLEVRRRPGRGWVTGPKARPFACPDVARPVAGGRSGPSPLD